MNVPFVDLKQQYKSIKSEIDAALIETCENTAFILGPKVKAFEEAWATFCQTTHAVGVSNGTTALQVAIQALGVGYGDEVIVPANTFIATSAAVTAVGGRVVFVDCDERTYNLDPAKIEAAITPKTKLILPVHLYGQPADMDPILAIAKKHGIPVLEDSSQAHGAEYHGKRVGSIGEAGTFSFYPGKNLGAYGEAGAVVTNDDALARRLRMLREHGSEQKYVHVMEGFNYRMEGFQGAVLGVKLPHLEGWTESRRRIAARYRELLADVDGLVLPYEMPDVRHVYHLFVVRVQNREEMAKFLAERGVGAAYHYPTPLHLQQAYAYLGHKEGDFPVAERTGREIISLPMFPELTDEQVVYVADVVKEYMAHAVSPV